MASRTENFHEEKRRRTSRASNYYGVSRALTSAKKASDLSNQMRKDLKKREQKKAIKSFFAFCAVVSLLVVGLITQLYFDNMYVSFDNVATMNKAVRNPNYNEILKLVKSYLNENPAQRVNFLLDRKRLTGHIQKEMPEILAVNVSKAGLFKSAVSISLREPLARYSDRFVDEHGAVFSENFFQEPSIVIVDGNQMATEGVSSKFLSFIGQVISSLKLQGEVVERVEIPKGAMRYVEFYLSGANYPFKAQIDREAVSQANDIFNMKNYLEMKGLSPLYADMRIEGKGYYK